MPNPNSADGVTPPNNPQATPRTDAARVRTHDGLIMDLLPTGEIVPADFARTLERELAASAREVEALRAEGLRQMAGWIDCAKTVTTLDAENQRLKDDVGRLDWLIEHNDYVLEQVATSFSSPFMWRMCRYIAGVHTPLSEWQESPRAAIDAAMRSTETKP